MQVELREITADTVRAVCRLALAPGQENFVAPNAVSLAQALFHPEAWYRAIYADGELAGFVMLEDQSRRPAPPADPQMGLWRFMIDQRFQGRGVGRLAIAEVAEHARQQGQAALYTSYIPGVGSPEPFYLGLGFVPTGEMDGEEIVARMPLR
jgi:diamine N-acetyltransferase